MKMGGVNKKRQWVKTNRRAHRECEEQGHAQPFQSCVNLLALAVDCEFVQTTNDECKVKNSLAQCSVVNINE